MASLKEIKTRIGSVKSTRQITSAMKMVSSAKLRHAQSRIDSMMPYQLKLNQILSSFLGAAEGEVNTIFTTARPVRRMAVVAFSSNTSLCGAFNSNVVRMAEKVVTQNQQELGSENVLFYPIGRKIEEAARKRGYQVQGTYQDMAAAPTFAQVQPLARQLTEMFLKDELDRVELIYHHFRSAGSQVLTHSTYLPIDLSFANTTTEENTESKYLKDYILEPSLEDLLMDIMPKVLNQQLFTVLADSCASEHAARMIAMQTATDNADDLIQELTKEYNKGRQQAITNELLDIAGGSSN